VSCSALVAAIPYGSYEESIDYTTISWSAKNIYGEIKPHEKMG